MTGPVLARPAEDVLQHVAVRVVRIVGYQRLQLEALEEPYEVRPLGEVLGELRVEQPGVADEVRDRFVREVTAEEPRARSSDTSQDSGDSGAPAGMWRFSRNPVVPSGYSPRPRSYQAGRAGTRPPERQRWAPLAESPDPAEPVHRPVLGHHRPKRRQGLPRSGGVDAALRVVAERLREYGEKSQT